MCRACAGRRQGMALLALPALPLPACMPAPAQHPALHTQFWPPPAPALCRTPLTCEENCRSDEVSTGLTCAKCEPRAVLRCAVLWSTASPLRALPPRQAPAMAAACPVVFRFAGLVKHPAPLEPVLPSSVGCCPPGRPALPCAGPYKGPWWSRKQMQYDAGLCYDWCRTGYYNVLNYCWQFCPKGAWPRGVAVTNQYCPHRTAVLCTTSHMLRLPACLRAGQLPGLRQCRCTRSAVQ